MSTVSHSDILALADKMDHLSENAQNVLKQYENTHNELHSSGGFQGEGGSANVSTTLQVVEAQTKVQNNFREVTDKLRSAAHGYANTDADNKSHLQNVVNGLHHT